MANLSEQTATVSKDYMPENFVDRIFDQEVISQGPHMEPALAEVSETDPKEIFLREWRRMEKDPEFKKTIEAAGLTREQAFEKFQKSLRAPIDADLDLQTEQLLRTDYQIESEEKFIVHKVDGTPVLYIPTGLLGAKQASYKSEIYIQATFVLLDLALLVASAIGLKVHLDHAKFKKAGVFKKIMNRLNPSVIRRMAALKEKEKIIDQVLLMARILRGFPGIPEVMKDLCKELGPWEKVSAVVNLIASIALLCVSGGVSLAAKIVSLGASSMAFVNDTIRFVVLLKKG